MTRDGDVDSSLGRGVGVDDERRVDSPGGLPGSEIGPRDGEWSGRPVQWSTVRVYKRTGNVADIGRGGRRGRGDRSGAVSVPVLSSRPLRDPDHPESKLILFSSLPGVTVVLPFLPPGDSGVPFLKTPS